MQSEHKPLREVRFELKAVTDAIGIPETDLAELTGGISNSTIRTYIARNSVELSAGRARPGPGEFSRSQYLTRQDLLRVCWTRALHDQARVPLGRCKLFMPLIEAALLRDLALCLWVRERADASDHDFAFGTTTRPEGAPDDAVCIHVGGIYTTLQRILDRLHLKALLESPELAAWPCRIPYVSDMSGAEWFLVTLAEDGEPDAEAVAAMCDAVERRDSVMLATPDIRCMARLVEIMDRLTATKVIA